MMYEFRFPDVGEGIKEGEIVEWLVKEGGKVRQDQPVARVETDKAVVELPSPVAGKIKKLYFKKGDAVKVGQAIAAIETAGAKQAKKEAVGVVGRIEEAEEGESIFERAEKATARAVVKPKYDIYGPVSRVPFRGVRKSTAVHMSEAVSRAAHVTQTDEADITKLAELREQGNAKSSVRITFLPYIIKACIKALKEHPYLNSSLDESGQEIVQKKYYNIGFAVSTGEGLLVPVIKGADNKSLADIAKEVAELAEKARSRKIDLADMKGSTFTVTNIGSVGGIFATPIVNYPESAILALGRISRKPVVFNGRIEARSILPLSLSFDHRVLDGAEAAGFLNDVIKYLENP
ncbi:MAG TPA: 2-oxo acid dehydrogenase subunit E2 [Nanoarchaeota archaeon]|nr:2-oxo acid dehydrogenase subunit E2 [Nanoarchaeota archaeon]